MIETKLYQISFQLLEHFLSAGTFSATRCYLEIAHQFSGKFNMKNHLSVLANILNTSKQNVLHKIRTLERLGLLNNHQNGWYFLVGKKAFNIANGVQHSKMVNIPSDVLIDTKKLRTFAYACVFGQTINFIRKKNQQKRDSVPLAGKFIATIKEDRIDRTLATWLGQRNKAAKLGYLDVQRRFEILQIGGVEIKNLVYRARVIEKEGFHFWWKMDEDTYEWRKELPSLVDTQIKFKKRRHTLTTEERRLVKSRYAGNIGKPK